MIKTNYNTIDLLKFIFCLCIIALHCNSLSFLPSIMIVGTTQMVFRLAVPFFFVTSGFLFGHKIFTISNNLKPDVLKLSTKKYCIRLLIPLTIFSLYNYLYLYITKVIIFKESNSIQTIIKILQKIIFYPAGALWYVQASIIAMLLLYYFIKHDKLWIAFFISCGGYAFGLLSNTYYFLLSDSPFKTIVDIYLKYCTSVRNGFFVGFFYICLGLIIARYKFYETKIKYIMVIAILSYITLFLEMIFTVTRQHADDYSLFISFLFLIPSIVILSIRINIGLPFPYTILRNLSSGMYFWHMPVLTIIKDFLPFKLANIFIYFLVVTICLSICLLSYNSKKKFLLKLTS